jgi:hypothetical protein
MAPGADRGPVRAFARNRGGRVRYEYRTVLPNVLNLRGIPATAVSQLERLPGVTRVEKDEYHRSLVKLHDSTSLIRGLQGQLAGAGFSNVDGEGVRVCVVDTGIDSDHVMYADRIDAAAGFDFANDDADPEDDHGHGSHVSGIALGGTGLSGDFGCVGPEPVQGVAPKATLIGAKVLDSRGGGNDSDIIAGIDHCASPDLANGPAHVINLSIGTGQFSGSCDTHAWAAAANNASDAGVVVVAAAGNEGYQGALASPACGSNVIAVGATYDENFPNCEDPTDTFTWCLDFLCLSTCTDSSPRVDDLVCFSNRSDALDVAAPGCNVYSADSSDQQGQGTTISPACGTSMAAPHVAGLAALVLDADPSLTSPMVRQIIRDGAIDFGSPGFDSSYGHGRIDVIQSLALATPQVCGDGTCGHGEDRCGCAVDCGAPDAAEVSCADAADDDCDGLIDCADPDCTSDPACICDGDGACELGEDCNNCPSDCVSGSGASCGNGICEAGDGEDCVSCAADCNGAQSGRPSGRFCCGDGDGQNPLSCSDARCTVGGLDCSDAPTSASCCGDAVCEGAEDGVACPLDCGACGDGVCDPGEDLCLCATDCGAPPASELLCTDDVDDDCDGSVDCADSDCGADPACACSVAGESCSANADCCSNRCKGRRGSRTCQ